MGRPKKPDEMKRVRISVPESDKEFLTWIFAQRSRYDSLRLLMLEAKARYGDGDVILAKAAMPYAEPKVQRQVTQPEVSLAMEQPVEVVRELEVAESPPVVPDTVPVTVTSSTESSNQSDIEARLQAMQGVMASGG